MRDAYGRMQPGYAGAPLERFLRNCQFDATTGCVLWTGGTTTGRGHTAPYGAFWFEGRRWFAHRWAAKYIHGQTIDDMQVDHCCPRHARPKPNTLCVEHVQAIEPVMNRELQWIRVQVGLLPAPPVDLGPGDVPFYLPPEWIRLAA